VIPLASARKGAAPAEKQPEEHGEGEVGIPEIVHDQSCSCEERMGPALAEGIAVVLGMLTLSALVLLWNGEMQDTRLGLLAVYAVVVAAAFLWMHIRRRRRDKALKASSTESGATSSETYFNGRKRKID